MQDDMTYKWNTARREACNARAEHIVGVLSTRFICEGWHEAFDQKRAAQFVENVRTFDASDGADPRFPQILEWLSDHNQCLNWLVDGDIGPLICRAAASTRS